MYKRQTKKRNSLICSLFYRLFKTFFSFFEFFSFVCAFVDASFSILKKLLNSSENFEMKILANDVVLCIRTFHVNVLEYHYIQILFLFRKFFLIIFLFLHSPSTFRQYLSSFLFLFFFTHPLQRRWTEQLNCFDNSSFRFR